MEIHTFLYFIQNTIFIFSGGILRIMHSLPILQSTNFCHFYCGIKHLISIGSTDVWGSVWEIYDCPYHDDDEDNDGDWEWENKRVLYRWENFNSLIPPKQGWKLVNISDDSATMKQPFTVQYTIGRKSTSY